MGWIQVIRYHGEDDSAEETVLVDTTPQLAGTGMPYYAWGVRPTFFDAQSTTNKEVVWNADAFLVISPDALMTRVVQPVCGFRWGYTVQSGTPTGPGAR